jgi:hypothetical protein
MDGLTAGLKKAERLEPMLFEGLPGEEELRQIDRYADALAEKINALGDRLL